MNKVIIKNFIFLIMSIFLLSFLLGAKPTAYGYDYYQQIKAAPASYNRSRYFNYKSLAFNNKSEVISDILITNDYKFIATKTTIYLYNKDYQIIYKTNPSINGLTSFIDKSNNTLEFDEITSLAYNENKLYVANISDEQSKIFVFDLVKLLNDKDTKVVQELYLTSKSNVPGIKEVGFVPLKVRVSKTGTIYVICRNLVEGILELDENNNFKGFIGTNKITLSALESFWRKISPNSANKKKYLPVTFSSMSLDNRGFLYVTTSSKGSKPIQKLNFKGENVLVENGNTKVIGDIYDDNKYQSSFEDIDVNNYGIYLALDYSVASKDDNFIPKARIFAYNSSGDLLYIIGAKGRDSYDFLTEPKAIRWDNDKILIVDNGNGLSRLIELSPTKYGDNINKAVALYEQGEFSQAKPYWEKTLLSNSNNELAYIGLGKVALREQNNKQALEYFYKGNSRIYYSKVYKKIRNERLGKVLIPALLGFIGLIIISRGVIYWCKKR